MNLSNYAKQDFLNSVFNFVDSNLNVKDPDSNIFETDEKFEIQIALPGIQKEDTQIEIKEGVLTVKAERKIEIPEDTKVIRNEITGYSVNQKYKVPNSVNTEEINANLEDGILKIQLNKSEEKQAIKISIN